VTAAPASPSAPLLACRALDCGYRRPVLRGVTLQVAAGEAWFVLGPNGAGKSTLVATLLGLLPPLAGDVQPLSPLARAQLGYVPQEPRSELALPVQVGEWVGSALPDTIGRAEAGARTAVALQTMGCSALAASELRRLSHGQRRRVFVARALVRSPRLLVLDEPGANLDRGSVLRLAADLEQLRREQGLAIVHVAHDLEVARRCATHVAIVAGGFVVAGPAAALLSDPAVVATVDGGVV
jgi:ABC-type Mn2+/Zn2+ transport system ATPase subunit